MILDKIVDVKRTQLYEQKTKQSLEKIRSEAQANVVVRRSFKNALTQDGEIAIIGEVKKASPSKGLIRPEFNPETIARAYAGAHVQALSVLTETEFFLGDPEYLKKARAASGLPVLRKDFIIDPWQIYETYLLGADAMLLITAILDNEALSGFIRLAQSFDIDALVEVHNETELERALKAGAEIVGINNRDLNDFSVTIETTESLIPLIPEEKVIVSESGIHTAEDLKRIRTAGADAVLIGEAFMKEPDIAGAVNRIRGTA